MESNKINQISTKQRRLILKKLRSLKNAACDRKKGIYTKYLYQSGFVIDDVSELIPHPKSHVQEENDLNSCKIFLYNFEITGTSVED